jgi:hypothetical protein
LEFFCREGNIDVNTAVQAEEFAEGENNLFSIGDYLDVILEEKVRL